jgi:hypothetical protein
MSKKIFVVAEGFSFANKGMVYKPGDEISAAVFGGDQEGFKRRIEKKQVITKDVLTAEEEEAAAKKAEKEAEKEKEKAEAVAKKAAEEAEAAERKQREEALAAAKKAEDEAARKLAEAAAANSAANGQGGN